LGVVHGGEPSQPPGVEGQRLRVGPAHLVSLNRRDTPPGNACQVRSGPVVTGQCGLILLPPRCLEDQKGLTASDDQASDLHLLSSGGGI